MSASTPQQQQKRITYPTLSLAMYRELAAHLEQIEGVKVELIPQTSQQFDYYQSQIEGLIIHYPSDLSDRTQTQLETILNYYMGNGE